MRSIPLRDCTDLLKTLESTLFDAEEAFEDGRRYAADYRLFLLKESPKIALVRGFHVNLREWWGRVEARALQANRPLQASGFVHAVNELYTSEDVTSFGDFEPVPCLRGQVRITKPEAVHGSPVSTGQRARRTILPWYVGVQVLEKGTLDVEECDDWNSYVSRICVRRHRKILRLATPTMGQALVCRLPWDDARVIEQAAQLLGPNQDAAWTVIRRCCLDSLRAFKTAFHQQRARELACYPATLPTIGKPSSSSVAMLASRLSVATSIQTRTRPRQLVKSPKSARRGSPPAAFPRPLEPPYLCVRCAKRGPRERCVRKDPYSKCNYCKKSKNECLEMPEEFWPTARKLQVLYKEARHVDPRSEARDDARRKFITIKNLQEAGAKLELADPSLLDV
ncbi:hypothetical protein MMC07_003381 [Pseudocyphellaria aurata]|nr:hypothetical protein [Pseudocyphellaria aurata]